MVNQDLRPEKPVKQANEIYEDQIFKAWNQEIIKMRNTVNEISGELENIKKYLIEFDYVVRNVHALNNSLGQCYGLYIKAFTPQQGQTPQQPVTPQKMAQNDDEPTLTLEEIEESLSKAEIKEDAEGITGTVHLKPVAKPIAEPVKEPLKREVKKKETVNISAMNAADLMKKYEKGK